MDMEQETDFRLWDSQWTNVVNHAFCYRDFTKEEAVALAVKLTEQAMARNFMDGKFPPRRGPIEGVEP